MPPCATAKGTDESRKSRRSPVVYVLRFAAHSAAAQPARVPEARDPAHTHPGFSSRQAPGKPTAGTALMLHWVGNVGPGPERRLCKVLRHGLSSSDGRRRHDSHTAVANTRTTTSTAIATSRPAPLVPLVLRTHRFRRLIPVPPGSTAVPFSPSLMAPLLTWSANLIRDGFAPASRCMRNTQRRDPVRPRSRAPAHYSADTAGIADSHRGR